MSSILDNIKTTVLGVNSSNTDKLIDTALQNISMYSSNTNKNRFVETLKSLIPSTGTTGDGIIKQLQQGMPQAQTYDQSGRISRYDEYEAICNKIAYCKRALDTLVDHIISPDDINKNSLQIIPFERDKKDDQLNTALSRLKDITKHFDIESKIKSVIRTTLKKGDNFVEIVKTPKGKNALVVVNESVDLSSSTKQIFESTYVITSSESDVEPTTVKVIMDSIGGVQFGGVFSGMGSKTYDGGLPTQVAAGGFEPRSKDHGKPSTSNDNPSEDEFKSKFDIEDKPADDITKSDTIDMSDLSIVVHDPKYVIRLETQRFKICLGYLVFPKVDIAYMVSNIAAQTNIDSICANLLNDVQKNLSKAPQDDKIQIDDEVRKVLIAHLGKIRKNEDLKIRYVSPELMQHFRINNDKFDPYGESIFECVSFDCRMLMALKTASTVKRLNSCTDKRFVNIEIGLPRDANNMVQQMKEQFTKKKISVDSMGGINTIPSQISTYENIYIPMKDGKKYIEIDQQQWGGDPSADIENLKFIRDNIVGNIGVPSAYLNIEDGVGNRSILTTESINFCRTIISYQKELSIPLREFMYKIYILLYGKSEIDILNQIQITYQEPKISPYEHQMEYIENMQRIIDALSALGIPKNWLKRQYLPNFNWDEIEQGIVSDKLDKELNDQPADDGMAGLMGGGMMGGAGMGGVPGM